MTRIPIRLRIAAVFAISMAVVLAATSWFLYARLDSHLTTALDHNLLVRAQDVTALVDRPGALLASDATGRFVERGESYAEVLSPAGRVLDATPQLDRTNLLTGAELTRAAQETIYANRESVPGLDEPSRLLATPIERLGRRAVLIVGGTRQDRNEALSSLEHELFISGPVALALATIAGYLLAGLSLRPVERMRARAEAVSAEKPGERLPVPRTGDELERLGVTLNEMLARLEQALDREREFVADAGHELRTPLALLRTELELALRHSTSPEELREAVRRSSEEVDLLAQLAEDLLLIARSDRGKLPLRVERLDADDLLGTVVRRFEWRAQEAGRDLHADAAAGVSVAADRIRMEQALGNLVDNALRHGGGAVRLSAAQMNGAVELHVRDEGGGFPPDFLEQAFERFTRADHGRTGGGAGLGLSIVRAIAEAHGGTAHATNADPGGADVWVAMPAT